MRCFCCSSLPYSQCCEPFLTGAAVPDYAEQLMRSRFSAYAQGNYRYVLQTYTEVKQKGLSTENLAENAQGSTWFALAINASSPSSPEFSRETLERDTVEFTAYYFENKQVFQLHETSNFIKENGVWRYHDGTLHDDCGKIKVGRNLPCLCGSEKKFKQCCSTKLR